MSARSIWNGTLAIGAVALPVKVYSAVERRGIAFREVRASDGTRLRRRRVGAQSGEDVAYEEIERAYEDDRGVVVLSKEEIATADGPAPKVIEIDHVVRAREIDPAFYDVAYHLGAGPGGERAYRLLLAALERSERVGIGRFVLRSRERLVAVRPLQGALGLQTMRFADELVRAQDLEPPVPTRAPTDREVEMATRLVDMLAGDWRHEDHDDAYRRAVLELVAAKRRGEAAPEVPEPRAPADDLAAALEASLAGGGR